MYLYLYVHVHIHKIPICLDDLHVRSHHKLCPHSKQKVFISPSRAFFFCPARIFEGGSHIHRCSNKIQNGWYFINAENQNARRLAFAAHIKTAFAQARLGKMHYSSDKGAPEVSSARDSISSYWLSPWSNSFSLVMVQCSEFPLHKSDALLVTQEWEAPESTSLSFLHMSNQILTQHNRRSPY